MQEEYFTVRCCSFDTLCVHDCCSPRSSPRHQWLQTIVVNGVLATAKTQNGTFATYSTLLWGVQIRQARVGAGAGCELPQRIRESGIVTRPCTAEYSSSTRSVQPYGPSRTENVPGADGVVRPITRFEYAASRDAPNRPPLRGLTRHAAQVHLE